MESPRRNPDSSALTDVSFNDDMSAASASPETQTKTSQENDSSPQTITSPSLSDYLLSLELQVVLEDEELEDEKKDVVEFTILEYFQADEIDFSQLLVKIYGMDDKKALQQVRSKSARSQATSMTFTNNSSLRSSCPRRLWSPTKTT